MKKLFKRIAPLLLALVMVMGSCLTVSAAESVDYEAMAKATGVLDQYPYFVIWKSSGSNGSDYSIKLSDVPFLSPANGTALGLSSSGKVIGFDVWSSTGYTKQAHDVRSYSAAVWFVGPSSNKISIDYTNHDIWFPNADKENDQPVFRGPERPLVAAVRGASPEEALKEVILLIPLSILFLAGCLGLRKGLRLLLTLLHQA